MSRATGAPCPTRSTSCRTGSALPSAMNGCAGVASDRIQSRDGCPLLRHIGWSQSSPMRPGIPGAPTRASVAAAGEAPDPMIRSPPLRHSIILITGPAAHPRIVVRACVLLLPTSSRPEAPVRASQSRSAKRLAAQLSQRIARPQPFASSLAGSANGHGGRSDRDLCVAHATVGLSLT
jgi:hypothetical protein